MVRKFGFALCFLLLAFLFCPGQPVFPDRSELYRDDVVARIDILIHPDSLEWIYDHVESDHVYF